MSIAMNIAKKVVHDTIEAQVSSIEAKLETLKAKAQAAKASAELKVIADLLMKKRVIDEKIDELRQSSETTYQQAKSDVESRIAQLEQSVKTMEAKLKAA